MPCCPFTTEARRKTNSRRFTQMNADQRFIQHSVCSTESQLRITRFWQLPIFSPCLRASVVNKQLGSLFWLRPTARPRPTGIAERTLGFEYHLRVEGREWVFSF